MEGGVVRATGDPQGQEHVLSAWEAASVIFSCFLSMECRVSFPPSLLSSEPKNF